MKVFLPILIFLLVQPIQAFAEAHTYKVTGVIKAVPYPESPSKTLTIRHEKIQNFVDIDGEVSDMESMTMPFTFDENTDVKKFKAGDKVTFDYQVDWKAKEKEHSTNLQLAEEKK